MATRVSKRQTPETALVKAILALCAYRHVPAYRIGTGSFALTDGHGGRRYFRGGAKGFPDIVLLTEGGAVFCEVKSATGRLSHEQAEFRIQCQDRGIKHVVARSVEDVRPYIEKEPF